MVRIMSDTSIIGNKSKKDHEWDNLKVVKVSEISPENRKQINL